MKLLFDHNISPKLIGALAELFPGSNHVYRLDLDRSEDIEIRRFAAENEYIVVTKDADYSELHSLYGFPPKVIWIRRGNCSTSAIEQLLRNHFSDIEQLIADNESGILSIY